MYLINSKSAPTPLIVAQSASSSHVQLTSGEESISTWSASTISAQFVNVPPSSTKVSISILIHSPAGTVPTPQRSTVAS